MLFMRAVALRCAKVLEYELITRGPGLMKT